MANIFFPYTPLPHRNQRVTIAIPFDFVLSKNRKFATARNGRMYVRADHKKACEQLEAQLREACKNYTWKKAPYYLAIHVQKENNRGDAANFLDAIADATKKAIGVDDCWLAVERITWEVKKDADRRIFISISQ